MAKVTYVKVLRLSKHEYEVGCEYDDETYQADSFCKNVVRAENRAKKIAELSNCDWGSDS